MPIRTRQPNVNAAQWSANGSALGAVDLTQAGAHVFGLNVFGILTPILRLLLRSEERTLRLRQGAPRGASGLMPDRETSRPLFVPDERSASVGA